MIHVVHIIVGLGVGGAELMLSRLIESHLGNPKFCHSVISLTSIGKVGANLQEMGVEVRALGMRSVLGIPRVLGQLIWQVHASRADIVQTWMYHADLLGGVAARLAGNRNVVWGVHSVDVQVGSSRATRVVRHACAQLSRCVPQSIVCVAEVSLKVHVALGYDVSRMAVIPNGVDSSKYVATPVQREMLRAECGFAADEIVIGTIGRFNLAKDFENFVGAAGLMASQNLNVRFLMIGRQLDSSNIELAHWIAQTGHANRFVLLGERSDIPVCLAAIDVFCLSSRTEAFPTVVCEAMAMGRPCVVTDVGDTAMLVADTGIVVPKGDSKALADGLKKIIDMTLIERETLGEKSRSRIEKEFSMNRLRERYEAIYNKVLANMLK